MIKISEIYEGWRNELLPPSKLKVMIREVARQRMLLCGECHFHSKNHKTRRPDNHCTSCGCTLRAKVKCLSCDCPENKWTSVLTPEQEQEIQDGKRQDYESDQDPSTATTGNP